MKLLEMYKMGGPYMNVISLMALVMLGVTALKTYKMVALKAFDFKLLGLIRMAGSFAAAMGILSQIIGIVMALEAIRAADDISPQIVMGGAIVSFYSTIWGLFVLLISLLLYYVLKEIVKHRQV